MFYIFLTAHAKVQLQRLKEDQGLKKRYKAIKKTIHLLSSNPRHNSLRTYEFSSLKGPNNEKFLLVILKERRQNLLFENSAFFSNIRGRRKSNSRPLAWQAEFPEFPYLLKISWILNFSYLCIVLPKDFYHPGRPNTLGFPNQ